MIRLSIFDLVISLLDIAFIAILIFVIHFYTIAGRTSPYTFFPFTFFTSQPLSLIIIFFLLFAIKNIMGQAVYKMQNRFVFAVASRLSENNLHHFFQGTYHDHVSIDSSVHINKISRGPIEFGQHILWGAQQIAGQSVLILITITTVLIFKPLLFLLLLIILTPPIILVSLFIKKRSTAIRKEAKLVHEKSLQHLKEALAGYIESNVYGKVEFFINRYSFQQARFNDFLAQQRAIQNMPYRFMEVFALFGLFALVILNYFNGDTGNIQLVTISAFMAAAYKIIPGIVKILNAIGQIKIYRYTVADQLHSQVNSPQKEKEKIPIASISMQNICFGYKNNLLVNNLSFKIKKGELAGLKGASGKGKTTVINLLLGFLDQSQGTIFVNDEMADMTSRQQFRKNISYVKQDPFLIHASILTNIVLDTRCDDMPRLKNVICATGLDMLISSYPDGLNTIINENGRNISGGQKQRIAIARALYKNADLIILDEPFNELDRPSEDKLLAYFRSLAESGKIIILVTHNKESLSYCSKTISLDET